jgi:Pyridoxal-phosphate dependent enzyme
VEIWNDTGGAVDILVSAVGTGGTITGVGELLKERKGAVKVVAVEPAGAAVLSGKPAGSHQMPGIGVGFVPQVLNRSIVVEVIAVSDEEAFVCARRLAREEGILAGVSSGAALHAALTLAARPQCAEQLRPFGIYRLLSVPGRNSSKFTRSPFAVFLHLSLPANDFDGKSDGKNILGVLFRNFTVKPIDSCHSHPATGTAVHGAPHSPTSLTLR